MKQTPEPAIKRMKLYTHVERVERELAALGLDAEVRLDVTALESIDQLHYRGLSAVADAIKAIAPDAHSRILDIGAGLGGPARVLAERCGSHITAVELQPDLNACARNLTNRCGLDERIDHICADIFDIEASSPGFDAIVSWLCFLHIDDKVALLEHCRALTRSGGYLYIEDFTLEQMPTKREAQLLSEDVFCRRLLSADQYAKALNVAGFEVTERVDLTADWRAFVTERLAAFEAGRERFEGLHGAEAYAALDHFYSSVVELFGGPALGGIRLVARARAA